jgi:hypothetical protein
MNVREDRFERFPSEGSGSSIEERRSCRRTKVNWQVEYTGVSNAHGLIHEGTRLVDYSQLGACFLAMTDVQPGMRLTMHVSLPVRMARPLAFRGVVVRVEEGADVMRLFKEVGVRWQPDLKTEPANDVAQSQTPPLS